MVEQAPVDWPTCDQDGCIGIQLSVGQMCLAHASEEERHDALDRLRDGNLDMRGVRASSQLLERVLAAAHDYENDRPVFRVPRFDGAIFEGTALFRRADFRGDAIFHGATFKGSADFGQATFGGGAEFDTATFEGDALFQETTFEGHAGFDEATFHDHAGFNEAPFHGDALFQRATFHSGAEFDEAIFHGNAGFRGAIFHGNTGFEGATFPGTAEFVGATFHGTAWFMGATFHGDAGFVGGTFHRDAHFGGDLPRHRRVRGGDLPRQHRVRGCDLPRDRLVHGGDFRGPSQVQGATFEGEAEFRNVTFRRDALFHGVSFERTRQFGPLLAHRGLVLDDVRFAQPVQIEASTPGICCRRARFPAGVQFRLRWARVALDDADFPGPSILSGIPQLASKELAAKEAWIAKAWQRLLAGEISERPRLLSLRLANVAGLGLSNVDMADCRFVGAHNLDKLRLEADASFATAPTRTGRLSQGGWREAIAEERAWRASNHRWWWPKWTPPRWPDWLADKPQALNPGQIAGLYRALRKGLEDIKDEPGAADFYYGEMEMRRRAARPVERVVLTAYWLVSGYGLRAWRALVWLAGITAALAGAFYLVGFLLPPKPDTYWTSLLYAFRATLSLTDPEVTLTAWGKLLQAVLRLTGPVLLGLAILALRGRVKR
jgi:uncharacterized protein YjbI with pentapeptide repeats